MFQCILPVMRFFPIISVEVIICIQESYCRCEIGCLRQSVTFSFDLIATVGAGGWTEQSEN